MKTRRNILQRLGALEGNLDEELQRLALLRSQGKLPFLGGVKHGNGRGGTTTIRFKINYFRAHVNFAKDQCWEWKGVISTNGYGVICIDCTCFQVHRVSFVLFNGREPQKKHLPPLRQPTLCKSRPLL